MIGVTKKKQDKQTTSPLKQQIDYSKISNAITAIKIECQSLSSNVDNSLSDNASYNCATSQISERFSVPPTVRLKGVPRKSQSSNDCRTLIARVNHTIRLKDCEGRFTMHSVSSADDDIEQEKNLSSLPSKMPTDPNNPLFMTQ